MKGFLATLLLSMTSITAFSQVSITKLVDTMAGKVYWSDAGVLFLEEDKGFRVSTNFEYNSETPVVEGLDFKIAGLGSCVEDVQIILLFEDGTKITKTCWNDFNCEGNAWFRFTKAELETIFGTPLTKVRVTNGRTYDSVTIDCAEPNHFIEISRLASEGVFEVVEME